MDVAQERGASRRNGPEGTPFTLPGCGVLLQQPEEAERIRKQVYRTRDLAKANIFEYIEMHYNRTRRHSHLGGVSPEVFEAASNCGL